MFEMTEEQFNECEQAERIKHDEKVRDLEKENAELKETLKTYNGCGDWDNDFHTCRVYLQHEELQEYIDQLTKAKEIIKDLLNLPFASNEEVFADVGSHLYKAEQFLKDCEAETKIKE